MKLNNRKIKPISLTELLQQQRFLLLQELKKKSVLSIRGQLGCVLQIVMEGLLTTLICAVKDKYNLVS